MEIQRYFFIVTKPSTYGWKDPRLKLNSYRTMTLVYLGYRYFVRARWNWFSRGPESVEIVNEVTRKICDYSKLFDCLSLSIGIIYKVSKYSTGPFKKKR